MSNDNVVIEEGGMRFVFEITGDYKKACNDCIVAKTATQCHDSFPSIEKMCEGMRAALNYRLKVVSATKIQPDPKMYFAWNREEARHLVGKVVEFHTGTCDSEWVTATLDCIDNAGSPFLSGSTFGKIIREAKTTKLTLAKLIEMAGIEGDVEIVEEDGQ